MTNFVTSAQGRFYVHILPTTKFRTRHVAVKLVQPLIRERVTECAILPYLWMEGTTDYPSALAVMRYADELFGASIRSFINKRGDRHVLEVQSSSPEEGTVAEAGEVFEKVRHLLFQLITDPLLGERGFDKGNVEREKGLHEKRIQSLFDDKISYALERCLEEMCKDVPAGLPRLGYQDEVASLTSEQLWKTYQDLLSSSHVHVYVVGNVPDPTEFGQRFMEQLHGYFAAGQRMAVEKVTSLPVRDGEVREVTDKQPVQQGKLNLGFRTGVSYGDPVYLPLLVANGVLGGFPHSKLFMNVRERASLAYYASSRLDGLTGIATIQTGIEVANRDQAYDIILKQVDALKAGEITEDELEFTKRGLQNQYRQVLDQPQSLAEIHFSSVLAGLNRNVEELLQQITAVTKEQATEAANQLQLDTVYFLTGEEVAKDA